MRSCMNKDFCDCNIIYKDKVDNTKKWMPKEEILHKVSNFFKIIVDPTREKILLL